MVSFMVRLAVLDGILAELVELDQMPLEVLVDTVFEILSDDQITDD